MNLGDFFKNLKLDYWYKVVLVLGALIIIGSLVIELKGITNQQGLLLGGALFCLGLGEWSNHTAEIYERPPNVYIAVRVFSVTRWRPTLIGSLLDLSGIYLGVKFIQSF